MRSSLFFALFFIFSIVASGFEDDDFEKQFEAEAATHPGSPSQKEEFGLKVEEVQGEEEETEEHFFDEFDDEEFVSSKKGGQQQHQHQHQQQHQDQHQQIKEAVAPKRRQPPPKTLSSDELLIEFIPDLCIIGLIIAYILYYFFGRRQNQQIANKFGEEFGDLFREAFLYLGVGGDTLRRSDTIKNNTDMIATLSSTEYGILGTGHKHCAGILTTLVLKSRQDVFSVIYNHFMKEKDELMIEVPMNTLEPMNCLIVRKADRESYEPAHGDRIAANEPIDSSDFGKDFCLVSDCDRAVVAAIFGNRDVATTMRKYSKLGFIKSIHFTDQKKNSTHKKCLRFVFVLPEDVAQLKTLLKMTLYLVDFLAQYKHSAKARQTLENSRVKASLNDKREKRQEKLQQKKDKEWSSMTEDQRKKKLEREKMRKLKKRAGQMKVLSM